MLQAFLGLLALVFFGYTYRIDNMGVCDSAIPIYGNLMLGCAVLFVGRSTETKLVIKEFKSLDFFLTLWLIGSVCKMIFGSIFITDAIFNYLLPCLLFSRYSAKLVGKILKIVVITGFFYYSLLGARGYAVIPVLMVFFYDIKSVWKKMSFLGKVLTLFIALFLAGNYMNMIEIYRVVFGRDNISLVGIKEALINSNQHKDDLFRLVGSERAPWDRLINHPLSAMFDYSGKLRGLSFIVQDVHMVFDRNASNYTNKLFGHWTSANYGFTATRTSSVEWGVYSDFASRFGCYAGLVLTFFSYLLIALLGKMLSFRNNFVYYQIVIQVLMSFFVFNFFEVIHMMLKTAVLIQILHLFFCDVLGFRKVWNS